jgi:hypothetical protein
MAKPPTGAAFLCPAFAVPMSAVRFARENRRGGAAGFPASVMDPPPVAVTNKKATGVTAGGPSRPQGAAERFRVTC